MVIEKKPPRAARRYTYECMGQLTLGNELDDVQITNISASGIQFETQHKLKLNKHYNLLWNDSILGILSSTMFVMREIHKPEREKFPYIYGARYHELDEEIKEKLILLIRRLRENETKDALARVQETSPDILLDVAANNPKKHMKKLLSGEEELLPALSKALGHLAEYEKKSFIQHDALAGVIQDLCAQTFQCEVLSFLVPIVAKHPELKSKYFQTVTTIVKQTRDTIDDKNNLLDQLAKVYETIRQNETFIKQVMESKNRIFYSRQRLLQLVHATFEQVDGKKPEFEPSFKVITSEFEYTLLVTGGKSFDLEAMDIVRKEDLPKGVGDEIIRRQKRNPRSKFLPTLVFIALTALLILLFARLF